jgi:hypothetical protein
VAGTLDKKILLAWLFIFTLTITLPARANMLEDIFRDFEKLRSPYNEMIIGNTESLFTNALGSLGNNSDSPIWLDVYGHRTKDDNGSTTVQGLTLGTTIFWENAEKTNVHRELFLSY